MRIYKTTSPESRFWDKFMAEPNSGCWLWMAAINNKGYGQVGGEDGRRGKLVFAHRLSWMIHYGAIPDGLCVLHRCDIPSCVNPNHLFLGTKAENLKDMTNKGRRKNQNSRKTHCIHGHVLDGENLYLQKDRNNSIHRRCRACMISAKLRYRKKRALNGIAGLPQSII